MSEAEKATLVVGADSDMGSEIIKGLSGVVIAHYCMYEEKLADLSGDGRKIVAVKGDLSSVEGINAFIGEVSSLGFEIDKLVHLPAAPAAPARFRDFDEARFSRDFNISLMSAALICKAFLPAMAKRKFGRVVFMLTSYNIGVPPKFLTNYVVCKYALEGLMKSLAAEYASKGITVNGTAPSMAETKFLSTLPGLSIEQNANANPTGRNATPADIAPTVLHLLSDNNEYITGAVVPITGGSAF
ncbi:MAG: SDR family oxidoreductase [Ruminococcaceae bacterium]|nr:SDR family oxidoreductase [Oscillospiraceae bacterium]